MTQIEHTPPTDHETTPNPEFEDTLPLSLKRLTTLERALERARAEVGNHLSVLCRALYGPTVTTLSVRLDTERPLYYTVISMKVFDGSGTQLAIQTKGIYALLQLDALPQAGLKSLEACDFEREHFLEPGWENETHDTETLLAFESTVGDLSLELRDSYALALEHRLLIPSGGRWKFEIYPRLEHRPDSA